MASPITSITISSMCKLTRGKKDRLGKVKLSQKKTFGCISLTKNIQEKNMIYCYVYITIILYRCRTILKKYLKQRQNIQNSCTNFIIFFIIILQFILIFIIYFHSQILYLNENIQSNIFQKNIKKGKQEYLYILQKFTVMILVVQIKIISNIFNYKMQPKFKNQQYNNYNQKVQQQFLNQLQTHSLFNNHTDKQFTNFNNYNSHNKIFQQNQKKLIYIFFIYFSQYI
eukprot:TRINITY_DN2930_c0_g3_i1.p2 TRINITY_DN2930_c0_g3~~TRINITY_DN2930_c0_g3_i1.p2  ORF type:complete len:227 (+),score=-14.15 TRINITY_DN2930_c0_g3_i1:756-1436(+)